MARNYRFHREDFGPLHFHPLHYDLVFDVLADSVRVVATQTYMCMESAPQTTMILNAHDLDVSSVSTCARHSLLGPPPVGVGATLPDFLAHRDSWSEWSETAFEYDKDERTVTVTLPRTMTKGDEVVIRTVSTCYPNDRVLEGIYYDYTPDGAPQTMITQCQQYGFQRIVPCVDRMASKTFYTTTVIADRRYSNVLSNGDVAPQCTAADGGPKFIGIDEAFTSAQLSEEGAHSLSLRSAPEGVERHAIVYHNHKVNMAPYLFFLGLGTYDVYRRELEYADGDSFTLELVCFPNLVKEEHAVQSLSALHDSIQWLHLSCGPEAYAHTDERARIYSLIQEREELKSKASPLVRRDGASVSAGTPDEATSTRVGEIRAELKSLISAWKETGYKYTGTCYREIAMENSNFGGMENVGNTTIISSRLTPSNWLVDDGYVYMEGVKIHEFYHNINGSQVTGASPFEIWLNEAVTVHVQRQREDEIFGHAFMRLRHVAYALTPASGPLAQDRSPVSKAIEPEGFNTTHELISAMTYSKAPEFVRMVSLIIGQENFVRALENYHQKYAYSNATTDQWVAEMAAFAPPSIDLHAVSNGWLKRTGYPTVHASAPKYDAESKRISISLRQSGFEEHEEEKRYPWVIPLEWALIRNGTNTHSGVFILSDATGELVVEGVDEPADVVSIGRDWSFFGTVVHEGETMEEMVHRAKQETDAVNRYLAVTAIVYQVKGAIVQAVLEGNSDAKVSEAYVELFGHVLNDSHMTAGAKAALLTVSESCSEELSHHYQAIATARRAALQAACDGNAATVLRMARELISSSSGVRRIGERKLKYLLFSVLMSGFCCPSALPSRKDRTLGDLAALAAQDGDSSFDIVGELVSFLSSDAMSDKSFALVALLQLPDDVVPKERKQEIQNTVKGQWTEHPIGTEQYISCISRVDSDNSISLLRELIEEPFFKFSLAGHARTVARAWSANRKRSIVTPKGLEFTAELFLRVGKVNQMSAYSFLQAFGDVAKLNHDEQEMARSTLKKMHEGLDAQAQQSLYNQLETILTSF